MLRQPLLFVIDLAPIEWQAGTFARVVTRDVVGLSLFGGRVQCEREQCYVPS